MEASVLATLVTDFGPFIALVVYIMFENNRREKNYHSREAEFILETRKREEKYIEREEKYIEVIGSLTKSFEEIREDVSYIKNKVDKDKEVR